MSIVTIRNEYLTVEIATLGAEIKSVKSLKGTEFIWCADPEIWGNSAPILFPVCGALKNDSFTYKGKTYKMEEKHGFARFMEFAIKEVTDTKAVFSLRETEETLKNYPFKFELEASYELKGDTLDINFAVTNKGEDTMYYSVGCHEGYACPEGIGEYEVVLPKETTLVNHFTEGPLMNGETEVFAKDCRVLSLRPDIFEIDSLIFVDSGISSVELRHKNSSKKVTVTFPGFDALLFWQQVGAKYICIEPWKGLPDYVDHDGDFTKKPRILTVEPGKTDVSEHSIKFEG